MFYDHKAIDKKWQKFWQENQTFITADAENTDLPKFYALDMFPYPSGAGLHVGHPLGYIASDIYARYKRHQGFNVLHPIGYDSFGLPAEQYAIQTGQHPAVTTEENITRYEEQLRKLGFSFDWSREVRTSDSAYYKWTQWIFIEFFHSWYNKATDKAEKIETLIAHLEKNGTENLNAAETENLNISAEEWANFSEEEKQKILLNYRLAYRAETTVNWCPGLGTVLANDEIKDGKSERGGFPVFQKKMMQWSMRISAYSERLLEGLEHIDWPQPLKDSQKYWIGKSVGAEVEFKILNSSANISVFTTRPDTIFGATFMVLAPENLLIEDITSSDQKSEVENYIAETSKKTERDRMTDVKTVSGAFTGSYAINPFTKKEIPIYISDYVLMGYGTGAVMAVPAHDERDHRFAKKFGIEILQVVEADVDIQEKSFDSKDSVCVNSEFLNGLKYEEAKAKIISEIENRGIGKGSINYRQRDAIFSRQRYWGEPVPVYYKDEIPYTLPISVLPLELPEVEKYLPTEEGNPPLGNAKTFAWDEENQQIVDTNLIDHKTIFPLELSTMPGWAGSSWYFLRYMDPHNEDGFVNKEKADYWGAVDLYIGGSEHATGHLLYARFWNKFLKDRGFIEQDEPFKKLINQGMILGIIESLYKSQHNSNAIYHGKNRYLIFNDDEELGALLFDKKAIKEGFNVQVAGDWQQKLSIPIEFVKDYNNNEKEAYLNEEGILKYINWQAFKNPVFVTVEGYYKFSTKKFYNWDGSIRDIVDIKFFTDSEQGKMSKSKYNVVNPDEICEEYGADCLRLYEMFLGPLEQSKPWNTQGLSGVYGFLKKFYNLYYKEDAISISEEEPTKEEWKVLHTLIKKFESDIQSFSFNTSVSSFMIAVNDLQKLKCDKRAILEPLAIIISPYAPHICEELWSALGHKTSIEFEQLPVLDEKYLTEDEIEYPISINGKMKFKLLLPADLSKEEVEKCALNDERVQNALGGNAPKKIIVVPKKIVNIVM